MLHVLQLSWVIETCKIVIEIKQLTATNISSQEAEFQDTRDEKDNLSRKNRELREELRNVKTQLENVSQLHKKI